MQKRSVNRSSELSFPLPTILIFSPRSTINVMASKGALGFNQTHLHLSRSKRTRPLPPPTNTQQRTLGLRYNHGTQTGPTITIITTSRLSYCTGPCEGPVSRNGTLSLPVRAVRTSIPYTIIHNTSKHPHKKTKLGASHASTAPDITM